MQHEWLKCTARKTSRPEAVDVLIEQLKELSPALLKVVVNITDQNVRQSSACLLKSVNNCQSIYRFPGQHCAALRCVARQLRGGVVAARLGGVPAEPGESCRLLGGDAGCAQLAGERGREGRRSEVGGPGSHFPTSQANIDIPGCSSMAT